MLVAYDLKAAAVALLAPVMSGITVIEGPLSSGAEADSIIITVDSSTPVDLPEASDPGKARVLFARGRAVGGETSLTLTAVAASSRKAFTIIRDAAAALYNLRSVAKTGGGSFKVALMSCSHEGEDSYTEGQMMFSVSASAAFTHRQNPIGEGV